MGTFEVYTTGGGYHLWDIFNFLAMFTSGQMWMDMLTVGIVLGVLYAAVKMVLTGNLQGTMQYMLAVAVVGALGVGPKARVIIMDTTYPLEIYAAVDNVPFSVALVSHYTTTISYHLTRRMETLLSTPDNLVYQEHGMLFGASLMAQASRWRAVTPTIQQNLVSFMENCMVDGANIGLVDLDQLTRSGDLANFIGQTAPGALAYYDEVSEQVMRCPDGWANLETQIGDEVNRVLQTKAAARAPRHGLGQGIVDVNAISGTLDDFQALMGLAASDSTRYLKQSMMVLALDDAAGRLIANSGNSAAMSLYQVARSESQTRSSYQVIGANATKWVPLIKVVFEVLYFGAFPIVMLLMMTPLAVQVIRGYFGGFVWLAAWDPLSAILHTTLLKASTGWYREHTTTISGTTTSDVLNWANHFGVQSVEGDIATAAGYLMMSVPFLSFAIMFGASKMAGMATSMLAVGQGAAIDTGREAATGSINLGNASMNNMSANNWSMSHNMDAGRSTQTLSDGGTATRNHDGSVTHGAGSAQSHVGMSAMVGQTLREEVSDRSSESWRSVEAQSEDLSKSITTVASQLSDFGKSISTTQSAGGEQSWSASEDQRQQTSEAWKTVEDFAERHDLSTDLALKAMLGASAGGQVGGDLAKLSASLSADGSLSANGRENFEHALRAAKDQDFSSTLSTLISSSERAYASTGSSETETGSNSIRSNYDDMQQTAVRLSESYEQAQALEKANAWLQSQDMGYNAQITDAVIGKLQDKGYGPEEISGLVNPKSAAGVKRQQEIVGDILPEVIKDLGILSRDPGAAITPKPPDGGLYGPQDYQPIDHARAGAEVPKPAGGDYEIRADNASYLTSENFDRVHGELADKGRIAGDVDQRLREGTETANGSTLIALGERGAREVSETGAAVIDAIPDLGRTGPATEQNHSTGSAPSYPAPAPDPAGGGEGPAPSPRTIPPLSVVPATERDLTNYERDAMIRTVLGEAAGESETGQAAVAHVMRNRVMDAGFGDDPAEVALAMKQFSAWNSGAGGNHLVSKYNPGDAKYEEVGRIVDQVWNGETPDPTGGATYYYSPAGMSALVAEGAQSNTIPRWLEQQNAARGDEPVRIGGHIFTGRVRE